MLKSDECSLIDLLDGVCEHKDDVFIPSAQMMITILNNIIEAPNDPKFHSIKLTNTKINKYIVETTGATELLGQVGFGKTEHHLRIDETEVKDNLQQMAWLVHGLSDNITQRQVEQEREGGTCPRVDGTQKGKQEIMGRINSGTRQMMAYEDAQLQALVMRTVPVAELEKRAKECADPLPGRDQVLKELTRWFKKDFFKWFNPPACANCGEKMACKGMVQPLPAEAQYGAGRVELYQCAKQCYPFRYPRYNHPAKLLQTRTGRCGEFANCFAACARAMGFETRWVLDFTDHVWVEVYSDHSKRWLHVDPCEDKISTPLMYEAGWNKKLSYIFAFSRDEVVDVTWRYSKKRRETLLRRGKCGEAWLQQTIAGISKQCVERCNASVRRKEELVKRLKRERYEFHQRFALKAGEEIGRQSGEEAWRKARGEIGQASAPAPAPFKPYVFKPFHRDLVAGKFYRVRYTADGDHYFVNKEKIFDGWKNGVSACKNIIRKVEDDWKMAYLTRADTAEASIKWSFDFACARSSDGCPLVMESARIRFGSDTFDDHATISITAAVTQLSDIAGNGIKSLSLEQKEPDTFVLEPSEATKHIVHSNGEGTEGALRVTRGVALEICALLDGGKVGASNINTQLFRQELGKASFWFDIMFTLKRADAR